MRVAYENECRTPPLNRLKWLIVILTTLDAVTYLPLLVTRCSSEKSSPHPLCWHASLACYANPTKEPDSLRDSKENNDPLQAPAHLHFFLPILCDLELPCFPVLVNVFTTLKAAWLSRNAMAHMLLLGWRR